METIFKTIEELIENDKLSPIPLSTLPNQMGINLVSVEAFSWQKQDDGQLVNLTIYFTPNNN